MSCGAFYTSSLALLFVHQKASEYPLTNCQGLKDVQLGICARHCLNYRLVTSRTKSLCKSSELFSVLVIGSWMQFDT